MSDLDPSILENLLRQVEDPATTPAPADGEQGRALAEVLALRDALRAAAPVDGEHYTLTQVQALAQSRVDAGEAWEMPEHLAACPLCLEAYEVVLEAMPPVTTDFGRRSAELFRPAPASLRFRAPSRPRTRWLKSLAAAIVFMSLISGLYFYLRSTAPHVQTGGLILADGSLVKAGSPIPQMTDFVARDDTRATFRDGSEVRLEKDSLFSVMETADNTVIDLKFGSLSASVAKQKTGHHFNVRTSLGDVTVVGTRFNVGAKSEHADVYENYGNGTGWKTKNLRIAAITVNVDEGVVQVKSKFDQVRLTAGQTAVLREGEPNIDVTGATR